MAKAALNPPTYSEEDLMLLYEDVLALPSEPEKTADPTLQELEPQQFEQDRVVVCAAEERAVLNEQLASSSAPLPPYWRLLMHTHTALSRIEAARETIKHSPNPEPSITKNEFLPVTLLTFPDFCSILRLSIRAGDAEAADLTLDLMKRSGLVIPEDMLNPLLKVYASTGNVQGAEQVLVRYLDATSSHKIPSHFHPANTIPSSALALLHSYETQALHMPIHTYTSEAIKLAKEMLDSHRDARGETYCALLEGAKRVEDLPRARWILAQMIAGLSEAQEEAVNEEVMMHEYRQPVEVTQAETDGMSSTTTELSPADLQSSSQPTNIEAHEPKSAFSHIPPQSGAEVIHEVQILYDRILYDSGLKTLSDPTYGGALR
ncbi:hypothetical protein DXG01_012728 [Tephrocybe rancida]|nr:hypothetical protein DXG01_012728 [Tephrocybe rancida]